MSSPEPTEEEIARERARLEEEEARARAQWEYEQQQEPQIAKSIIATDDRYAPDNIEDELWRPVWAIFFNYPGESKGRLSSGVLIGPRLVLTAVHNLFDLKAGRPIMEGDVRVGVSAGSSKARSPISTVQVLKSYKKQKATDKKKYNHDYRLILLQNDAVNNWAGSVWSIDNMTPFKNKALKKSKLIVAGYPVEDGESKTALKLSNGPVTGVASKSFAYNMDTTGGQSGGPVFHYDDSRKSVSLAGVHVAGFDQRGNLAKRFDASTKTQIQSWSTRLLNLGA